MPLLCNAQLCPCWQSWVSSNRKFCVYLVSHIPLFTAGSRNENEAMPDLSLSLFCSLSSLFPPATILVSCRRHHSSIQAVSAREKKIVLPFAHQMLSVVPLLSPAQRGVVAQTMGRKRNTQVFLYLSLPIKNQGNSSFHPRNARVWFRHVSKVFCLCQHRKGIWLEQVKLFVVSHGAHTLKVQMFPPCSKG